MVSRGEVWRARFPDGKDRPGVIASPNVRNTEGENVILAGCSSRRTETIYPSEVKLSGLDLPRETKVQADYLFTIKQQRLKERLAQLTDEQQEKFNRALLISLDLV
ncbi:MAG: type II toxin-antitoxin system PemK/MazF family toxin [bacterium]